MSFSFLQGHVSLFPVADLTGMPLLSPDAKLRFLICNVDEDRGSLLHFKRSREASGTAGVAAEGTGYWKLPANRALCVCVCVWLAQI